MFWSELETCLSSDGRSGYLWVGSDQAPGRGPAQQGQGETSLKQKNKKQFQNQFT